MPPTKKEEDLEEECGNCKHWKAEPQTLYTLGWCGVVKKVKGVQSDCNGCEFYDMWKDGAE